MLRVAAFSAAALLSGCGGAVDHGTYVGANERLFATLPTFPGARLESRVSTAYRSDEIGPVAGCGTRFDLTLPPEATASVVGRRGTAFVPVNAENARVHRLEIADDHDFFGKVGR